MRFCLGRESDDSRGCLALNRRIVLFGLSVMQLVRARESNDASRRRALQKHFRLLAIRKYVINELEKAMIQMVAWH